MAGLPLDWCAGMEHRAHTQKPITEPILQKSASLVSRNSSIPSREWGGSILGRLRRHGWVSPASGRLHCTSEELAQIVVRPLECKRGINGPRGRGMCLARSSRTCAETRRRE